MGLPSPRFFNSHCFTHRSQQEPSQAVDTGRERREHPGKAMWPSTSPLPQEQGVTGALEHSARK